MRVRSGRKIWLVALMVFVAVFLFTFLTAKFKDNTDVEAANLANFDPGYIISDYQMGNYNSMSEAEIQRFLTAKNPCNNTDYNSYVSMTNRYPGYSWHWANGHFICISEERFGDGEVIGSGDMAAHIIWQAAQDYRINPQVLIVLLQKEQGLITDTFPHNRQYRAATGYGCPDTAACSSQYYGFKNQVRKAAAMFRTVLDGGWTNYPLGWNYVQYNPNSACGGSWINIRSLATSALYRYTPYQPNASALAAGYGTGDACGAYGNRNFYNYFEDWFGGITVSEARSQGRTIEDGVYQFISVANYGEAIDIEGGVKAGMNSGNTMIFERKKQQMDNQLFEIKYDDRNGYYSIVNPTTGLALDVANGSMNNDAQLLMWQQHDGCNQDWVIEPEGDEEYTIISRCSSRVLDATLSNDLVMYEKHGGNNQKWVLGRVAKSAGRTVQNGIYQIISVADHGEAISAVRKEPEDGVIDKRASVLKRNIDDMDGQLFKIEYNEDDGYYSIIDPMTGLAFDVEGASVKNDAPIVMWQQHDGCNQDWVIDSSGGEKFTIISRCSSKVLDATSVNEVVSYSSHGGNNQKWVLGNITEGIGKTIENGVYQFVSKVDFNKVIDIEGGVFEGMNSGIPIIYSKRSEQIENQLFEVKYNIDTGYYKISNPVSGLALDVSGSEVTNDTPVLMWSPHVGCNQDWVLEPDYEGYYTILSRCSNKVLDATIKNKLVIYGRHNGANQKWQLVNKRG